jgi:hypothetical protein
VGIAVKDSFIPLLQNATGFSKFISTRHP